MSVLVFLGILLFLYALILFFIFVFQNKLIFSPTYYRDDEKFLALEEYLTPLALVTQDEVLLEGIMYEPQDVSKKIILYFGGVQQDSVALVEKFASPYPKMPFITYNYRGYGKSEGKPSQSKLFEDSMRIYDDLIIRYQYKPEDIILMGYSLGTGVASFLGSQRQVSEILLMAPYDSVYEVMKKRYPFSGIHWILKQKFPSTDFVPRIDVPIHIYAGSDDKVVNIKHAKMLKSCINNLAGFYEYGDVGHNDILFNPDVVAHIKEFLEK
ncbi:MAG: hypothetical protein GQ474_05835 [Sulfurimonas sp.]|nr:hypothetical protein [Sulfurimonas sp.]